MSDQSLKYVVTFMLDDTPVETAGPFASRKVAEEFGRLYAQDHEGIEYEAVLLLDPREYAPGDHCEACKPDAPCAHWDNEA